MTPVLLTPPETEPLSLAEAKAWLRLDGAEEDATIEALIAAARMTIEQQARRLMIAQGWRLIGDLWPTDGIVLLPLAPVLAVTAIRVRDTLGVASAVPLSNVRLEAARDPARLVLTQAPPPPGRLTSGIEIDVTCGYGDAAADVPEPLRHATRLLVARWFERRGDEGLDSRALPPDVAMLLAPLRAPRLA